MRICIISPNRKAYSETFIKAHIDRLSEVALVLTDGFLPKRRSNGELLLDPSILKRVARKLSGKDLEEQLKEKVKAEIAAHNIDVVLAEYGPTGEAMLAICQELKIPLVVHFHGVDAFHDKLLEEHDNYVRIRKGAFAIFAVSREMEKQLLDLGTPREKLHFNYYGIDAEHFKMADPENVPTNFVSVGRFADTKAPYFTVLAFHKAWQQMPELRLTMIGQGPLQETCWQLRRSLGMGSAIEFAGVMKPDEVAATMRGSRAFVQHSVITSLSDREGTPLAVLEAMSTGIPVIATRHAGIGEVVLHEETGLLCEEGDIHTMADHILKVAKDPQLAAQYGKAGRQRILENHRVEDRIATLQSVLESAAK